MSVFSARLLLGATNDVEPVLATHKQTPYLDISCKSGEVNTPSGF